MEYELSTHTVANDQPHIDNSGPLVTYRLGLELVHVYSLIVSLISSPNLP